MNPDSGYYHLSADVPGVEANELRKTLGIRPTPNSLGGALRGVLHITGPLEQPVFSGEQQGPMLVCRAAEIRTCAAGAHDCLRAAPVL